MIITRRNDIAGITFRIFVPLLNDKNIISSVAGSPAGSRVTADSGSPSAVGSGNCSVHRDDGWLVSGGGVGLAGSSTVRQSKDSQHPLNIFGETPPRTVYGQACLQLLAEAGLIEDA